ncbi:MAG: hypothetical protein ACTSRG_25360 [Candidatus Helarchaeota archaeon]
MIEKNFSIKNYLETILKNDIINSFVLENKLSEMQTILMGFLYPIYNDPECLKFWECRQNLRWEFEPIHVSEDAKLPNTKRRYQKIDKSFPNKLKLTGNQIKVIQYIPEGNSIFYEIFEYFETPKSLEASEIFLELFCENHRFKKNKDWNYL